MTKGLIYLSIPMRDYAGSNFEHGDNKACELSDDGWVVISPVDMDRAQGIDGSAQEYDPAVINNLLRRDITALLTVNAAYFCKDYEASRGCNIEHAIARGIGLQCFYEVPRDDEKYVYSWGNSMVRYTT
jgi:hypothetical protein